MAARDNQADLTSRGHAMRKRQIVFERLGIVVKQTDEHCGTAAVDPDYALPEITIPEEVPGGIRINAFKLIGDTPSEVRKIQLPKSIEKFFFSDERWCARFLEIEIDKSNPYLLSDGKAVYTRRRKLVYFYADTVKDYEILKGTRYVGKSAFADMTGLRHVKLPEGLKSIGANAFYGCSGIKELHIPQSVDKIDDCAFAEMLSLQELTVAEGNQCFTAENGILYSKDKTRLLLAFDCEDCFTVPDTVREIGKSAFSERSVKEITLSPNVSVIGSAAFLGCSDLKRINLENVKEIGQGAFYSCVSLESVSLTCGYIPELAFRHCYGLKSVTLENTKAIGMEAFECCYELERAVLPEGFEELGDKAFFECGKLSVSLPCSVIAVGYSALLVREVEIHESFGIERVEEFLLEYHTTKSIAVRGDNGGILFKISTDCRSASDKIILEAAGSGFKEYGFDFSAYDGVLADWLCERLLPFFYSDEKVRAVLMRLEYPMGLSDKAKEKYLIYLKYNGERIASAAVRENDRLTFEYCMRLGLLTAENITALLGETLEYGRVEFTAALLEYKNLRFPDFRPDLKLD